MNSFKKFIIESQNELLLEQVSEISYAEVQRRKMFGPVYHGTTPERQEQIKKDGFKIFIGLSRSGDISHGYPMGGYGAGSIPPPVHHLGYGVYFTTVKAIARDYNGRSVAGLRPYYLDVPRLETINFGSPNTMMKWWQANGYDMDSSQDELKRMQSTINLTNTLKEKCDAVYYKGKGLRRLLDGDQICVFDPSRIYVINPELNAENEFSPGDRFVIKGTNIIATVRGVRDKYLQVDYKDPEKQLPKIYGEEIIKENENTIEGLIDRLKERYATTNEEEVKQRYIDFYFDGGSIKLNFPKTWAGRKLKKGERLKKS
jgi:hypothetical protein